MRNLVVIESDLKIMRDIQKYLGFLREDVTANYFSSYKEFSYRYFIDEIKKLKEENPDLAKSIEDQNGNVEQKANYLKNIGLILVGVEVLGNEPLKWINDCKEKLKKNNLLPTEYEVRFVILAHENTNLEHLCLEDIEDVIFRPLDQQFFLQKMEICLNLPKTATPSFLFHQKSSDEVEMGKQTKILEISEAGLALRNPKALAKGQFARMYTKAFSEQGHTSIVAKSYKSVEDPNNKNSFYCYFSYFGIVKEQITHLRRYFAKNQKTIEKSKLSPLVHRSTTQSEDVVLSKETSVVIIDMDKASNSVFKTWLQSEFPSANTFEFPTFTNFAREAIPLSLDPKMSADSSTSKANISDDQKKQEATLLPGGQVEIQIFKSNFAISQIRYSADPSKSDSGESLLFGFTEAELKSEDCPLWKQIYILDRDNYIDFLKYASTDQAAEIEVKFMSKLGQECPVRVTAKGHESFIVLQVYDRRAEIEMQKAGNFLQKNKLKKIDAILIDASFIPQANSKSWTENLLANIKLAGLEPKDTKPKIIVMGHAGYTNIDNFQNTAIDDFIFKPLDRSLLMQKILLNLYPGSNRAKSLDLQYYTSFQNVFLTTKVKMKEISEFGISIMYPAYIRPGSFIRFVSEIIQLQDGSPIIGRCIYSDKEANEEGMHACSFIFFGVNDVVFKKIRLWIREKYVASKSNA